MNSANMNSRKVFRRIVTSIVTAVIVFGPAGSAGAGEADRTCTTIGQQSYSPFMWYTSLWLGNHQQGGMVYGTTKTEVEGICSDWVDNGNLPT